MRTSKAAVDECVRDRCRQGSGRGADDAGSSPDHIEQTLGGQLALPQEWDRRTRAHDTDGLLELYLPDAVLESPLIFRRLDQRAACLSGTSRCGPYPNAAPTTLRTISRRHRTDQYQFNGLTLIWESPVRRPTATDRPRK